MCKDGEYLKKSYPIMIKEGTRLHGLYGNQALINSFHHQAIKDVAPSFEVSAWAKDGVIEAIEKQREKFVVGVQWHPEMMAKKHTSMLNLFKLFIEHVQQSAIKKSAFNVQIYCVTNMKKAVHNGLPFCID
ncbi:gamma-glutamyl-gamma-aminobutyrate hydrolase family protein [Priestia megaterium]|nr:gamma-glutamyl-gamma-aminobutyrate hydrolase family protein [Priestia megaterium]